MTLPAAFAAAMAALGPFESRPRLAVAVSGGADSTALALLAWDWAERRDGSLLGLVVDHGLRPASAAEASLTLERLRAQRIPGRMLRLADLRRGPALAERARIARYDALRAACRAEGRLHLLLGHHAGDQAETVLLRREGGSGPDGLAAMPALVELHDVRLLRPLLTVAPGRLREFLRAAGLDWVEDPSNQDVRATRPRLRAMLAGLEAGPDGMAGLAQAAHRAGLLRTARECRTADRLARRTAIYPEGFARIPPGAIEPRGLAALIQMVSGALYPPPSASVAALAAAPVAATLAGVRIMPAGRFGDGWLLLREAAALAPPVPAEPGAWWDGRFRLAAAAEPPEGSTLGALGPEAARLRRFSPLPAAILQTLPAVRRRNLLVAVPHLAYPDKEACARLVIRFSPSRPAAGAPFLPA